VTIFVPAARVSRIKISPTTAASARVRELKAAGRDIVDMAIGEPDFDTPDDVKAAAHAAIVNTMCIQGSPSYVFVWPRRPGFVLISPCVFALIPSAVMRVTM